MYRQSKIMIGTVVFLFLILLQPYGLCAGLPDITADAAVVLDARTGSILYARHPYQQRPPASTTKILTTIVALENGRLSDQVTISPNAGHTEGSTIYLRPGEKLALEELIWGALLESGNDACVAIAEHLAGSEVEFSKLQNRKAKAVGAWDTHFVNPHGLTDPNHYTTAYDLGAIARYALRNSKFQQIVRTQEKQSQEPDEIRSFFNTNRLLWSYGGCDGVKTGTTSAAGQCLVASASKKGRQLVAVVLHSDDRWSDATALLDYGFASSCLLKPASVGQVTQFPLPGGLSSMLTARAASDLYIVVPSELAGQVRVLWQPISNLKAPVNRGDKIGEVQVWLQDEFIGSTSLQATSTMPARSLITILLWQVYRPLLFRLRSWHLL
jgi:D-alanyl-D-alanine carboxypeptidase (penicillin-binding protein 5/6)